MSSATDAVAGEKVPARRFPPPCWAKEETLALIEAYRERWYAVRRGYLRASDWDGVAAAVAGRCPDASPAKTSAQCRHKMEKLRQRYRAEKQRSLSYPAGRFFSNWLFFDNMDALENGTRSDHVSGDNFGLKNLISQSILKLKLNPKNGTTYVQDSNPNSGFDQESRPIHFQSRVSNAYCSYLDAATTKEDQMDAPDFGIRNWVDDISVPAGFKANKICRLDKRDEHGEDDGTDQGTGVVTMVINGRNLELPLMGNHGGVTVAENSNLDSGIPHKFLSSLSASGKGRGKRGRESVYQIASSIKLLGEEFIKMEKMKMEMAKEIEQWRIEMETKRNEMITEFQKQITDAFVRALSNTTKNKKAKTDDT